jgi:hypothetical protein
MMGLIVILLPASCDAGKNHCVLLSIFFYIRMGKVGQTISQIGKALAKLFQS